MKGNDDAATKAAARPRALFASASASALAIVVFVVAVVVPAVPRAEAAFVGGTIARGGRRAPLASSSSWSSSLAAEAEARGRGREVGVGDDDADADADADVAAAAALRSSFDATPPDRRAFLSGAASACAALATALASGPEDALAAFGGFGGGRKSSTAVLDDRPLLQIEQPGRLSSGSASARRPERCLLELLPVRNPVFRSIEAQIVGLDSAISNPALVSDVAANPESDAAWTKASKSAKLILETLDSKRSRLEPTFDIEADSAEREIKKAERGELLIEELRTEVSGLVRAAEMRDVAALATTQRSALMALSEVGELLVGRFPYDVPSAGKYSFLPRLLGRARVTFTMKRGDRTLGNITVVADGFAAPITSGNFVDLCVRGFYTGLPIRSIQKRLGTAALYDDEGIVGNALANLPSRLPGRLGLLGEGEGEGPTLTTNVPVWGAFNEGFYDPLTAKPRRIPLEIVEKVPPPPASLRRKGDKASNSSPDGGSVGPYRMAYARGFTTAATELPPPASSPDSAAVLQGDNGGGGDQQQSRSPLLTFDIPGLVAMNHPDRYLNGGSSEFFVLPQRDVTAGKVELLNGQYAPFGYVIRGYDLLQELRPGDVIAATDVGEWGQLNLVKVRGTSLGEMFQGSGEAE